MADPFVRQARGVFSATVGVAVTAGDPVFFDGTNWLLADATDETKFAEAFAVNTLIANDVGNLCTSCIIVDTDAPYTQGGQIYLGTTAAVITSNTETRPTGANNLVQVLGFALSTSELKMEAKAPYEYHVSLSPMTDGTAVFDQNLDYTGVNLGATSEAAGYTCMVPQNAVSLEIVYLWWTNDAASAALDACDTYTVDVSAGGDDETNSSNSDGISAAALTVADNDLNRADITAGFNAAGTIQPGNVLGIDIDKAAETSTQDPIMLTCHLVFLVV